MIQMHVKYVPLICVHLGLSARLSVAQLCVSDISGISIDMVGEPRDKTGQDNRRELLLLCPVLSSFSLGSPTMSMAPYVNQPVYPSAVFVGIVRVREAISGCANIFAKKWTGTSARAYPRKCRSEFERCFHPLDIWHRYSSPRSTLSWRPSIRGFSLRVRILHEQNGIVCEFANIELK